MPKDLALETPNVDSNAVWSGVDEPNKKKAHGQVSESC